MERKTGFEPATPSLARRCSTTEPLPPPSANYIFPEPFFNLPLTMQILRLRLDSNQRYFGKRKKPVPQIRKFIDIDALPERVFAKATDPSLQPTWMTFLKEIEIISGDGKSAGTKDRSVMKLGPVPQSSEGEWIEYREPETFARKMRGGLEMESRMSIQPHGRWHPRRMANSL